MKEVFEIAANCAERVINEITNDSSDETVRRAFKEAQKSLVCQCIPNNLDDIVWINSYFKLKDEFARRKVGRREINYRDITFAETSIKDEHNLEVENIHNIIKSKNPADWMSRDDRESPPVSLTDLLNRPPLFGKEVCFELRRGTSLAISCNYQLNEIDKLNYYAEEVKLFRGVWENGLYVHVNPVGLSIFPGVDLAGCYLMLTSRASWDSIKQQLYHPLQYFLITMVAGRVCQVANRIIQMEYDERSRLESIEKVSKDIQRQLEGLDIKVHHLRVLTTPYKELLIEAASSAIKYFQSDRSKGFQHRWGKETEENKRSVLVAQIDEIIKAYRGTYEETYSENLIGLLETAYTPIYEYLNTPDYKTIAPMQSLTGIYSYLKASLYRPAYDESITLAYLKTWACIYTDPDSIIFSLVGKKTAYDSYLYDEDKGRLFHRVINIDIIKALDKWVEEASGKRTQWLRIEINVSYDSTDTPEKVSLTLRLTTENQKWITREGLSVRTIAESALKNPTYKPDQISGTFALLLNGKLGGAPTEGLHYGEDGNEIIRNFMYEGKHFQITLRIAGPTFFWEIIKSRQG